MNEDNKNGQNNGPGNNGGNIYAYVAIGLIVGGAVALGLSFTKLGIYSLIASLLLEMGAMSFINVQKKKNNLKWLFYIRIAAYILFAAAIVLFAIGTVWSAQK